MANAVRFGAPSFIHQGSGPPGPDGIITIRNTLKPGGISKLEINGKGQLGLDGTLQMARVLQNFVIPTILTKLNVRSVVGSPLCCVRSLSS